VTNEAFARVRIDQLLKDTEWKLTDGRSVRFEYPLDDGGKADYALFDRQGRALAVLEAKSTSVSLTAGEAQGRRYRSALCAVYFSLQRGRSLVLR
jgi:type I restriction enzyme, R subunit